MTDEDRRHARVVLEKGWLTIDDVASCKEAMEKTGLPFLDVARAKGLLTPEKIRELGFVPRPAGRRGIPIFYLVLIVLAPVLLIGSEVYLRIRERQKEEKMQREMAEARQRADEQAMETRDRARREFSDQHRAEADRWLKQGRILLLHIETTLAANPRENLEGSLKEALGHYTLFLEVHPAHADALFERAQLYLYRRALTDAERDLEAACRASPAQAADFRARFSELRRRLGR